ncbi:tetratricopeptide repeat protein [Rhodospirillales bacterium]|nr:tetratricopeptide repeat protein [Rhodospirillales bacterium]
MAKNERSPESEQQLVDLVDKQTQLLGQITNYLSPASEERRFERIAKLTTKVTSLFVLISSAILASWELGSYLYERWETQSLASKYAEVGIDLYYKENNVDVSQSFIKKALELDAGNADFLFLDAYIDGMASVRHLLNLDRPYNSEELKKAHEAIAKSILLREHSPKSSEPYILRGQIYIALKDFDNAKSMLLKAIEIDPKNEFALMRLGVVHYLAGDVDNANRYLTEAEKVNSQYKWTYLWRGVIALEQREQITSVRNWIEKAIEVDPKFDLAYYNLAWAQLKEKPKNYTEAENNFRRALALNPSYKEAYYGLGMVFGYQKQYELSDQYLSKALELDEQYLTAYKWRGIVRDEMGDYESALKDFSNALDLDPSNGDIYVRRARAAIKIPRYSDAMKDLDLAVRFDPSNHRIDLYKADIYLNLGKFDAALKSATSALEKKPRYAEALSTRATVFEKLGRIDQAIADLTAAIGVASYRPERFYKDRAELYYRLNRIQEANNDFKEVLSLDPRNTNAIEHLIEIYIKDKDQEAAKDMLDKLITVNPSNSGIPDWQEKVQNL